MRVIMCGLGVRDVELVCIEYYIYIFQQIDELKNSIGIVLKIPEIDITFLHEVLVVKLQFIHFYNHFVHFSHSFP